MPDQHECKYNVGTVAIYIIFLHLVLRLVVGSEVNLIIPVEDMNQLKLRLWPREKPLTPWILLLYFAKEVIHREKEKCHTISLIKRFIKMGGVKLAVNAWTLTTELRHCGKEKMN